MRKRKICRNCLYGINNYFSLGNHVLCSGVSNCTLISKHKTGEPFVEKENCDRFKPNRIPEPNNSTEQRLFFLSMQLEEISDLLSDVLAKLEPLEDNVATEKQVENKHDDK